MEVIEFTPTPEQYAYTFGGVAPVTVSYTHLRAHET